MNWKPRSALVAAVIGLALTAAACGSSPSTGSSTPKGTITVAGFKFSEGSVLAELYGQALQHDGYTVTFKLNLGSREVVAPAIKSGQIDLYIGYAATDLEYYNKGAGEATGVAKATQQKYSLAKLSDLQPVAGQLVLGAGPECPTRPYCLPGLMSLYGLHFKSFKALDTDGSLTRAAFKSGQIDVGLVFSSDGDLNSLGLVVLQDDKQLEAADNVVPILRQAVASDDAKK